MLQIWTRSSLGRAGKKWNSLREDIVPLHGAAIFAKLSIFQVDRKSERCNWRIDDDL
jgi:hypothetical protein